MDERVHHGQPDFRVGGKIFATLTNDETRLTLRLDRGEAEALAAGNPEVWTVVSTRGGCGWVRGELARITPDDLPDLLDEAWRLRAPAVRLRGPQR